MPGEPPTFPRLEPEAVPLPPAPRRRGRQNGRRRPGRSPNDIRHIPLTTWRKSPRQVGTTVSFAPLRAADGLPPRFACLGRKIVLSLVLVCGRGSQDGNPLFRQRHPFLQAAFPSLPPEKTGRTVADIPGHPERKTCAPQAKEQKRDERFRADVASAVPLLSSSVAHFFRQS